MALIKMKVTYNDGRTTEVTVSPRARVDTERYLGGYKSENATLANFHAAWASLDKTSRPDFETWLDQVADAEEVEVPEPDPTPEVPSAEGSSE